jgi:hypothetical protein
LLPESPNTQQNETSSTAGLAHPEHHDMNGMSTASV